MSLSPQFLDEIRARTTLSQLVGRDVRLKKAGNEWQACCPFHNEKTASFYVNDDKAFYHCFGCSAHGDAIKWLTETKGLEFLDAVRELAEAAGMTMPAADPVQRQQDQRDAGLHGVAGEAVAWFKAQLSGLVGGEARAYLDKRGIGREAIETFGIGFAPDGRNRLRSALSGAGDQALIDAGLLIKTDDDRDPYDRFRGRLMFPIHDPKGRPISFGGRIIGQGEPKYLNGPDTALFDKGRTLFNLHRAAPAARKAGRAIVVEGYMDVIGLAQIGIPEAVASCGTALTEAQMALLWRVVPEPILCFDGDAAGQRASAKAAIRALPGLQPGRTLRFALLPAGQDPDDIARAGGAKAVEAVLSAAIPLVELLWRHEHGVEPLATPEARAALRQRLIDHARTIGDPDLAREYESDFRRRVDRLFEQARPARGRRKATQPLTTLTHDTNPAQSIERKLLTAILRGLARHPKVAAQNVERIVQLRTTDLAQREALDLIINAAIEQATVEVEAIDAMFPHDRGWMGFRFSYTTPDAWPDLAVADLEHAIDMTVAMQDGLPTEELTRIRDAYVPPKPPEKGRLV